MSTPSSSRSSQQLQLAKSPALILSTSQMNDLLTSNAEKSTLAAAPSSKQAIATAKKLSAKDEQDLRDFERQRQLEHERQAIIASIFANAELQSKSVTLKQYETLYDATLEENKRLTKEKHESDQDAAVVIEFMRNEIGKLQAQIKEMRIDFFSTIDRERNDHEEMTSKLKAVIAERDRSVEDKDGRIDVLTADLEALAAFRREKESLQRELASLKEQLHASALEHEKEIAAQRFTSLEEKIRVKALEKELHARFEREVVERSTAMLDGKTKAVLAENGELQRDRTRREAEIEDALQQLEAAHEEIGRLKRELSVAQQTEKDLHKLLNARSRENQNLKEQVDAMDEKMNGVVVSARTAVSAAETTTRKDLVTLQKDRDQAVHAAKILRKDLLHVRKLANAILEQRTDTENFFLDALSFVRVQIGQERYLTMASDGHQHSTTTPISTAGATATATGPHSPRPPPPAFPPPPAIPTPSSMLAPKMHAAGVQPAVNVDISSLSWEDKERVLRALFAKIQSPYVEGSSNALSTNVGSSNNNSRINININTNNDNDSDNAPQFTPQKIAPCSNNSTSSLLLLENTDKKCGRLMIQGRGHPHHQKQPSPPPALLPPPPPAIIRYPLTKGRVELQHPQPDELPEDSDPALDSSPSYHQHRLQHHRNKKHHPSFPQQLLSPASSTVAPGVTSNYLPTTNATNIFFITEGSGCNNKKSGRDTKASATTTASMANVFPGDDDEDFGGLMDKHRHTTDNDNNDNNDDEGDDDDDDSDDDNGQSDDDDDVEFNPTNREGDGVDDDVTTFEANMTAALRRQRQQRLEQHDENEQPINMTPSSNCTLGPGRGGIRSHVGGTNKSSRRNVGGHDHTDVTLPQIAIGKRPSGPDLNPEGAI